MKLRLLVLLTFLLELNINAQSRWLKGAQLYGGVSLVSEFTFDPGNYPGQEYQGRDLGLGLMVGRRLGPQFTLMSGLNLVRRSSSYWTDFVSAGSTLTSTDKGYANYLEVPLTLKYRLRKFNRPWSPFVQAGLLVSVETNHKGTVTRSDGATGQYGDAYLRDLQLGPLVAAGAEFRLNRRTHLIVQPFGSVFSIISSDRGISPDTYYGLSLGVYYW
ncbi:MAG: PorT family protein [Bernardetiaceae bacterium]|jgi:hypothetical protein|nr:PorT family protein [Bernardetiaceae bacterium]